MGEGGRVSAHLTTPKPTGARPRHYFFGALVGLVFFAVGAFLCYENYRWLTTGTETTGTIINYTTSRSSDGDVSYYPVVQFHAPNGEAINFKASLGTGSIPEIRKQVAVMYMADNPSKADIKPGTAAWLFAGVFGFIGLGVVWLCARSALKLRAPKQDAPKIEGMPHYQHEDQTSNKG